MEKEQPPQSGSIIVAEETNTALSEKQIWKERLRDEILLEEKERIMSFVDSQVEKKMLEIEMLLEIAEKPAELFLVPITQPIEDDSDDIQIISETQLVPSDGSNKDDVEAKTKSPSLIPESNPSSLRPRETDELREFTISKVHLRPTKKRKAQQLRCTLCDLAVTCEANLEAHFKGKRHLTNSARLAKSNTASISTVTKEFKNEIRMEVNGKSYVVIEKSSGVWCEVCNWLCGNKREMSLHLSGSDHETNENHRKTGE